MRAAAKKRSAELRKLRRDRLFATARTAATSGNLREFYKVVRLLAPQGSKRRFQLCQGGAPLPPERELAIMPNTFALLASSMPLVNPASPWFFTKLSRILKPLSVLHPSSHTLRAALQRMPCVVCFTIARKLANCARHTRVIHTSASLDFGCPPGRGASRFALISLLPSTRFRMVWSERPFVKLVSPRDRRLCSSHGSAHALTTCICPD